MAITSSNLLSATITATDSGSNVPINRGIGNPTLGGTVGEFSLNQLLSAGAGVDNPISLPSATIFNLYIRNLAAPGGSIVTVKWTPTGGAAVTILALQPGSVIIFWEIVAVGGITTLTLNPTINNTPVEMFLGA